MIGSHLYNSLHIAMIVASHELARRINKARMRLDAMEVVS